ncbi:MAG: flagellar hook-basal body complex protein [Planctomycetota bacterium]|nr:flagellar hook-basal body complex protein [Planctomycetota bacterium]
MSDALLAGVSGLRAHQTMLDVAGNNLANVDTFGFKSSRVTFGELLSQTMREATQPTANVGGTNPQQVGAGVKVASIDRNMDQGNLIFTGQSLDMAIEGSGYFTLSDGQKDVYTRVGAFAVDAGFYLVDPSSGYRVQRIGSEGVAEGFQNASSDNIRIPYDVALPAKATQSVNFTGNLSPDSTTVAATNLLSSGIQYTVSGGMASQDTLLSDLDQATGIAAGDTIRITGTTTTGTAVDTPFTLAAGSTIGDLINAITAAFPGSTATLSNGEIRLSDSKAGYSQTDLNLTYTGGGTFTTPNYFKVLQVGGEEVRNTNVEVFDSQGVGHVLSVSFARTKTPNNWDVVLGSMTGDGYINNRRIQGVTFGGDGSYTGLLGGGDPTFSLRFGSGAGSVQDIQLNLGNVGQFDGLSQFGGASTVAANGQDGYEAGRLSSLSVSRDGVLVGMFTNGIRQDVAALKVTTFQNPAALESVGGGMFTASANSGDPLPTNAQSGGAGAVNGGSLEKSNVDMASEFVNLIQAQNGYQANARTIRVTNDMLLQLANIIR